MERRRFETPIETRVNTIIVLVEGRKRPVGDLCVSKCGGIPADFDPVEWNGGGQRVLHLDQKLEGRDG